MIYTKRLLNILGRVVQVSEVQPFKWSIKENYWAIKKVWKQGTTTDENALNHLLQEALLIAFLGKEVKGLSDLNGFPIITTAGIFDKTINKTETPYTDLNKSGMIKLSNYIDERYMELEEDLWFDIDKIRIEVEYIILNPLNQPSLTYKVLGEQVKEPITPLPYTILGRVSNRILDYDQIWKVKL
jgi:hypothetical protein